MRAFVSATVRGAFQNVGESDDVKRHGVVLINHVDTLFVQFVGEPSVLKETFERNGQYGRGRSIARAE